MLRPRVRGKRRLAGNERAKAQRSATTEVKLGDVTT
jgi:hypothetical protein